MSDVVYMRGQGGAVWEMTLPLQPAIARQYEAGDLERVNPDGAPYEEPDEEVHEEPPPAVQRAPKGAAEGA